MTQSIDRNELAARHHADLPQRLRDYLHARGIPDALIDRHLLGWNGWRITIPIVNRAGDVASFKLAKAPDDHGRSSKMFSSLGARLELYGWERVLAKPSRIVICEGEFDRLVLEAQGFEAVTSTGGASNFRPEWDRDFEAIPDVYICFDRDEAGERGVLKVGSMIPHAKVVRLPDDVGEGGDITDFFVRLGHNQADFEALLAEATPVPIPPPATLDQLPKWHGQDLDTAARRRIERLKATLPIADVVGRYVTLRSWENHVMGLCPFHEDHAPSLAIYPRTGTFYCFGCGKSGDIITFIREIEHLTFHQSLDRLEELLPHDPGTQEAH